MATLQDAIANAFITSQQNAGVEHPSIFQYQPAIQAFFNLANTLIKNFVNTNPTDNCNVCEFCHSRPKYRDGGVLHPFCGKTCAAQSNGIQTWVHVSNPGNVDCDFCHIHPKYFDGTKTHAYCGKACARKSKNSARSKFKSKPKPTVAASPSQVCLLCRSANKRPDSHFCGKWCADQAQREGPMILDIPEDHVSFSSVANQFKASWRHTAIPCPEVKKVYKIVSTESSVEAYNAYKESVEARGNFEAAGRTAGNECRRWHGCQRECNLGDPRKTKLCDSSTCSLCCIIRTSFDVSCFGKNTGWGRFGRGIYTSSTSSKSASYVKNASSSNFKPMLLNKVIVGKGYKMNSDNTKLTGPPAGYDSVIGEPSSTSTLNYDELICYTNDAIRPSYLVMYES